MGQSHDQLHALHIAIGQGAAGPVGLGLHIDLGQQGQRIATPVAGGARPPAEDFAIGRQQRHLHVFCNGERGKSLCNLKCAAHTAPPHIARRQAGDGFAVQQHLAAIGHQLAAHHIEGGALACAVGADQGQQFASLQIEADVLHSFHAAKGLADVLYLQQAHDAVPSFFGGANLAQSSCA